MENNFKLKPIISLGLLFIGVILTIALLGKILIPFLIALILTYIIHPFVEKIHKKLKVNLSIVSAIASVLILLVFLCIPFFLIPSLVIQIQNIITDIPSILGMINDKIFYPISIKYGITIDTNYNHVKELITQNIGYLYQNLSFISPIAKNSFIILEILIYMLLIPFIVFYININWYNIIFAIEKLIPKSHLPVTREFVKDLDSVLSAYLRGQISVILVLIAYYTITLHYIHLPSAILIGFMTGLLVFIPYLGIFIGFIASIVVTIGHFSDIHQLIYVLIIFVIGHILESWILTPFLVGSKIGLSPVMMIFALMIFGQLFGIVGLFLALPLVAITTVLFQYLKLYYLKSDYYNKF